MGMMFLVACKQQETMVEDVEGNLINLSDLRGNWVVINYWASWCKPCYEEIPQLNAFYEAHQKENITILSVSYDQVDNSKLKAIIKKLGIKYPVLVSDPADHFRIKQIPGLPATYVFSPDGKLKQKLFGAQTLVALELATEFRRLA